MSSMQWADSVVAVWGQARAKTHHASRMQEMVRSCNGEEDNIPGNQDVKKIKRELDDAMEVYLPDGNSEDLVVVGQLPTDSVVNDQMEIGFECPDEKKARVAALAQHAV